MALEQGFELCKFTYTGIFFNSKYYTTRSTVGWICGYEETIYLECWQKIILGFLTAQRAIIFDVHVVQGSTVYHSVFNPNTLLFWLL